MENLKIPLNLIVATCNNMGIGKNGTLPWPRLPKESKYFQVLTTTCREPGRQNAVILGRNTWESIPVKHRPLKNRINIVISRTLDQKQMPDDVHIFSSFDAAIQFLTESELANTIESIWNIGGREVYKCGLAHAAFNRLYLTRIFADYDCDVFFPDIDFTTLKIVNDPNVPAEVQEENGIRYKFDVFERLK